MSDTFRDKLQVFSNGILEDIKILLSQYSSLEYNNYSTTDVCFISITGDYWWKEISVEGKRLQSKIRKEYDKFRVIVGSLVGNSKFDELESIDMIINRVIDQEGSVFEETISKVFQRTREEFSKIDHFLDILHSSNETTIFVPDTNALIFNPRIENWKFDDIGSLSIVLSPTVLSELDKLKVEHRNPDVREKAKKLIGQIKEYRRRGSLLEGVNVKDKKIWLKSVAVEPDFDNTLPWLDVENNDDRFIASVLEIIRNNIRSSVIIVTGDINMQNKAEFSCMPYIEPPEIEEYS